jgi:outer membrane protein assembly factor BamB
MSTIVTGAAVRAAAFALYALLFALVPAHAADRVALVIGNGAYKFANTLPNPVNDATDIGAKLKTLGFEVFGGNDLDRAGMEVAIRQFAENSPGAKVVLFFYAGHGMEVNGKNYLIPVDAKLETATALNFEVVDANVVLNYMVEEKRIAIALLDACRNNPLARSFKKRSRSAVGSGLGDVKVDQVGGGGLLYGLATAPGDVAADGEGRNSPFTKALLKHIGSPGVEFEQMMKSVKRDVDTDTKGDQRPYLTSSLVEDLYLVPAAAAVAEKKTEEKAPAIEQPPQTSQTDLEWTRVKDSKSVAVLKAFIDKHSDDALYRGLAEERIAEIGKQEAAIVPRDAAKAEPEAAAEPDSQIAPELVAGPSPAEPDEQDVAIVAPPAEDSGAVKREMVEVSPQPRVIPLGKWPEGMALGPDNTLWIAESGSRQIVKIDLSSGQTVAKVPVGRLPVSMAAEPDGTVYAAVYTEGKLWRQPPTGKGRSIWKLKNKTDYFIGIGIGIGDGAVFAANYTEAAQRMTILTRIDPASGKAQSSEPLMGEARALVMAGGAPWLLYDTGTLAAYDPLQLTFVEGSDSSNFLWSLAANSDAVFAGGKNARPEGVSVVSRHAIADPNAKIERLLDGNELILAMAATDTRVAALGENGSVWILDATDLTPLKHFSTGVPPRSALFADGLLYVVVHQGDNGALMVYEGLTD